MSKIFLRVGGVYAPSRPSPGDVLIVGRNRCWMRRPRPTELSAAGNLFFKIGNEYVRVLPIHRTSSRSDPIALMIELDTQFQIDISSNGAIRWELETTRGFRLPLHDRRRFMAVSSEF